MRLCILACLLVASCISAPADDGPDLSYDGTAKLEPANRSAIDTLPAAQAYARGMELRDANELDRARDYMESAATPKPSSSSATGTCPAAASAST